MAGNPSTGLAKHLRRLAVPRACHRRPRSHRPCACSSPSGSFVPTRGLDCRTLRRHRGGTAAIRRFDLQLEGVLGEQQEFFERGGLDSATMTAWSMGSLLDSYLRKSGIESVGRLFHALLLTKRGVSAVPYQLVQPGSASPVGTRVSAAGRWTQVRPDGTEIELLDPCEIVSRSVESLKEGIRVSVIELALSPVRGSSRARRSHTLHSLSQRIQAFQGTGVEARRRNRNP